MILKAVNSKRYYLKKKKSDSSIKRANIILCTQWSLEFAISNI